MKNYKNLPRQRRDSYKGRRPFPIAYKSNQANTEKMSQGAVINWIQECDERNAFWAWYMGDALRGKKRRGPEDVNRIIDFKLSIEMEKVLRELDLI